jgi:O-antigen ligase
MAKLRIPAVAFGFLLFIAAGLAGIFFIGLSNGSVAAAWALTVLLGVIVALTVVAVLRSRNTGRAGEP